MRIEEFVTVNSVRPEILPQLLALTRLQNRYIQKYGSMANSFIIPLPVDFPNIGNIGWEIQRRYQICA